MELNFEKVKVLLVDDDLNFAFALKSLLKSKGLDIKAINNPKEALDFLKDNKVNMILLDYYMPEMTGEQFLIELRKFDKETIVFLQTAFSEEKPEFEMLQSLNIQGYIDKNKEPNDIFLDIVSGVKMANLLMIIKKQEREILKINYKKAIMGNLIVNLVNEAKDQLMQISAMNESIKMTTNEFEPENKGIKNALEKTYKLYEALNFEGLEECDKDKFNEIIEMLLKPTMILNNINIVFENNNNGTIITNVGEKIYITIKAIELYAECNCKKISVIENENNKIEIIAENGLSAEKIKELEMFDNKEIIYQDNKISFNL